tara:strand:+ start:2478 stop:2702 length:225 start_codon:yes stop_codon:yes gene_type:complete
MEHLIAVAIAAITGGGWTLSKFGTRMREIENKVDRMPIDYVLKADYIREMQRMNDTFSEINIKLDKLVERTIEK